MGHASVPWKKGNSHKFMQNRKVMRPLKISLRFEDNINVAVK
jgi:hypothetical protein